MDQALREVLDGLSVISLVVSVLTVFYFKRLVRQSHDHLAEVIYRAMIAHAEADHAPEKRIGFDPDADWKADNPA